jgi:hypothetical protein
LNNRNKLAIIFYCNIAGPASCQLHSGRVLQTARLGNTMRKGEANGHKMRIESGKSAMR